MRLWTPRELQHGKIDTRNMTPRQKAALLVSDLSSNGGYLTDENAASFIVLMIEQSMLLKDLRIVPMKSHTYNLDSMSFPNGVLRAGVEAQALSSADEANPDLGRSVISAKTFKAVVPITDEALEDNIEGPSFINSIQAALADAIARDVEDIILNSNTSTGATQAYRQFQGLFQLVSTNTVDGLDGGPSAAILEDTFMGMPQRFVGNRSKLKYYTSVKADTKLRTAYGGRLTTGGDSWLEEYRPIFFQGVPIVGLPLFPENVGTGSHCTFISLMDPKNVGVGFHRRLQMEMEKNVLASVNYLVATLRMGMNLVEETANVETANVNIQ